jgi:hypothetical protein
MNVVSLTDNLPERVSARLAALPEFDPPAHGFARVLARRAARRRRRLAGAFAVAAGLAAVALALGTRAPGPDAANAQARAQALEADAASARPAVVANAPIAALEGELARLDAALQAAYDRGAAPPELERLWQARTETLSALVAAYRHADSIVRI